MTMRPVISCFLVPVLILLFSPVYAQPPAAPADYPTLAALETTTVPAADAVELAQRLRGVAVIPAPPAAAPARAAGEQQDFWVLNSAANREFQVSATLRVVGEHIYLWVQDARDGVPVNVLDDAALRQLADAFDTYIYPRTRELWGSEPTPGVDGDPRIYGLFAYGLGPGVAAFFASRHIYPAEVHPTSNQHEMFLFNLDTISADLIASPAVASVVAHEFQHMIRAGIQHNDAIWLNEGLSSFTQLYLYRDASAALSFLSAPQTQLNTWAEDGPRAPHYGAALLFITYFYEQYGLEALQAVSTDPGTGLDSFDRVLRALDAAGVDDLFADWTLANLLLNPALAGGRYGYRLLPSGLSGALPEAAVTAYPYTAANSASQYSADYIVLANLNGAAALEIRLDMPAEVALIPTTPASGRWLWYSNRGDMSDTTLTRAFDLTGLETAALHYKVWYHLEDQWDYAYVMVSEDGGATWDILPTPHTSDVNPLSSAYGPGYTGHSGGWLDEQLSLDAYAGKEILVRFEMITDDAINQPGIALDDIRLPELEYSSDFETGGGGWESNGWIHMDNRLPQQAWVQAVQQAGSDVTVTRWLASAESAWTLPLADGVQQVTLVIAPFAPVTTIAMPYTLEVAAGG